jgi:hypothetical protein
MADTGMAVDEVAPLHLRSIDFGKIHAAQFALAGKAQWLYQAAQLLDQIVPLAFRCRRLQLTGLGCPECHVDRRLTKKAYALTWSGFISRTKAGKPQVMYPLASCR